MPTCRSCHQRITWLRTPGGKAIPVDEDPTDAWVLTVEKFDGSLVHRVERSRLTEEDLDRLMRQVPRPRGGTL